MAEEHPKGILRNASTHDYSSATQSEYDRKLVLENTKRNAELFKSGTTEGDKIREEIARKKRLHDVQFNKENLEENDKLKASMTFTKIDEPKTPYQGPVNEMNDYYRTDNEDEMPPADFSLGEGEDDDDDEEQGLESLHGTKIIPADEIEKAKREKLESQSSPEEAKHKKFEEMRKKHYHNEVVHPLKADALLDEEDDE